MARRDKDRCRLDDKTVWIWCEAHGKRAYPARRAAKAAIRVFGDASGMREYRCGALADRWHVGHMPAVVRRGRLSAKEVYRHGTGTPGEVA